MQVELIANMLKEYDKKRLKSLVRYFIDPRDLGRVRVFAKSLGNDQERELTRAELFELLTILASRKTHAHQRSEKYLAVLMKEVVFALNPVPSVAPYLKADEQRQQQIKRLAHITENNMLIQVLNAFKGSALLRHRETAKKSILLLQQEPKLIEVLQKASLLEQLEALKEMKLFSFKHLKILSFLNKLEPNMMIEDHIKTFFAKDKQHLETLSKKIQARFSQSVNSKKMNRAQKVYETLRQFLASQIAKCQQARATFSYRIKFQAHPNQIPHQAHAFFNRATCSLNAAAPALQRQY